MLDDYYQRKNDQGKLAWDLLPLDALEGIVRVLEFGARKYSADSWKQVENAGRRYKAAMRRHQVAIDAGEMIDPETGLPHIYHVACNAMFLCWFEGKETKDGQDKSADKT